MLGSSPEAQWVKPCARHVRNTEWQIQAVYMRKHAHTETQKNVKHRKMCGHQSNGRMEFKYKRKVNTTTGQEQESNIVSHEFSVSHTQMKTVLTFRHTHQEQWMYEGLMPQRFDDHVSKEKKGFHCEKLLYVIGWTQVSMSAEMHKYTEISLHSIWTDICANTHKPCCKKLAKQKWQQSVD